MSLLTAIPLSINLSQKNALITGATGQLGRVMVKTLAQCGANIAIHYRRNQKQAETLLTAVEECGVTGCIVSGDIGSRDDMFAMKESVEQQLGPPDIVVTNAVSQIFPWRSVIDEEIEDYDNQFRSCVMHNVLAAKAFVPHMMNRNWGRFIGINTEAAIQTHEYQSAYAAGKRGMDGILRVLSREAGPHGVTVNQVAPGWTITHKKQNKLVDAQKAYAQKVPLRRQGDAQEIANVVAFLASDLASFVNGAFIPVNGGNTFVGI